ncbi:MAG TPA: BCCT family transporter [Erysipelotrichaceae bacterium]|nr:BCCT family transporter [Erysipelotrichaceae bacterium]
MDLEKANKKLRSRNFTKFGLDMNIFVSVVTAVLVLAFIIFTISKPVLSAEVFSNINTYISTNFNWLYVVTINASLIFLIYLGFSKYGKIRLGGYTAKPEFSNIAWYAMMFSAGIGIGIFFYGVAEPIYHFNIPAALQSGSDFDNFKVMFLNWGAHAWAVYGLLAIGLGYFSYNLNLPFSIRSLFYPILKEKIYSYWGDLIDTIATLSVLFGLATSLGLGAKQINSGLNYVFGIADASYVQLILIIVINFVATLSVVSGLSKGVKWLSDANLFISGALLLAITLIGPTTYILSTYLSSMGVYIRDFINIGLFTATNASDVAWQGAWTIFYWAWWVSWAPFVGTFIARISKGRTIKQIAFGVLIVPTLAIIFSMTILGASGVFVNNLNGGVIEAAINTNVATSMFEMFKYLTISPILQGLLSITAVIAVIIFFVTSSDSGSLVVSSLTSSGLENPPKAQRVFWAVMEGLIAVSILLIGGEAAILTIQSAVVILGLPFSIMLLMIIFSMGKELKTSYVKYNFNRNLTLKRRLRNIDADAKFKE